jgi:hypothetical protein
MLSKTRIVICLAAVFFAQTAFGQQQIEHGAAVQRGWLNHRLAIEPLDGRTPMAIS